MLSIKPGDDPGSIKQIRIEANGELCENVEVLEATNDRGKKTATVRIIWNEYQNDKPDSLRSGVEREPRSRRKRSDQSESEVSDNGGV